MNAKEFKKLTGHEAEQDDLERVNCEDFGSIGHYHCGLCKKCGQPNFMCSCPKPKRWGYMELKQDKRAKAQQPAQEDE